MPLSTSEESALVGDLVFSKKGKEYSDLVAMFSQCTIDPTMTPLEFYNDPTNKAKDSLQVTGTVPMHMILDCR